MENEVKINDHQVALSSISLTISSSISLEVVVVGMESLISIDGTYSYNNGTLVFELESGNFSTFEDVFTAMLGIINPVTYSDGSLLKDGTAIFTK